MKNLTKLLQAQFDKMCTTNHLFRSNITGNLLWETYLNSFESEYNKIFRDPNSSEHNCNICKHFMRNYGNVIAFDENYNMMTIWDIEPEEKYKKPVNALKQLLHENKINTYFVESYQNLKQQPYEKCNKSNEFFRLGLDKNHKVYTVDEADLYGVVEPGHIYEFNHFSLLIPSKFVDKTYNSIATIISDKLSSQQVFLRGLSEIESSTVEFVIELINNNAILNGLSQLEKLERFLQHKTIFDTLNNEQKIIYTFKNIDYVSKFKNELIGVLCMDIQSKDVEKACLDWNKRVDPVNYKQASKPISKKQIAEAKQFVQENGYEESFNRRCANIDDISAHEILHLNENKPKNVSVFDSVIPSKSVNLKNYDNVPEISISEFMENLLPQTSSLELLVKNELNDNFVTLHTSDNPDSKKIFKWDNNFGWTYNGNLSGKSTIKKAVKAAGGYVDAPFRCSIMWNEDGKNIVDLDLHCETSEYHIYFRQKLDKMGTKLDVDMIRPSKTGVENIFNKNLQNLKDGVYSFYVHNYDNGCVSNGFKCEIVFDGEVYNYCYPFQFKGNVKIADLHIQNSKLIKIEHHLEPDFIQTKEIYNLKTNEFHKVTLLCKSPNYWNDNKVGNLHYFFILENCRNSNKINTIHNEFLNTDLSNHRRVIQILATTLQVECLDNQLSGVGFNSTMNEEIIVKTVIKDKTNIYKIKF